MPDSAWEFDVCPRCGYGLAGPTTQPCPECGMGVAEWLALHEKHGAEHAANLDGLRVCYEIWRVVVVLSLLAAVLSLSWVLALVALVSVGMAIACRRVSDKAHNPLDIVAEFEEYSTLRVRRLVWAFFAIALAMVVSLVSLVWHIAFW